MRGVLMRNMIEKQLTFGEVDISQIQLNINSRDDIPQLLKGLQHIYTQDEIRKKVFEILEKKITPDVNKKQGRPGMSLWKILVMGTLRLNLNWDYDRLHEMVNNHVKIREMLGHGLFNNDLLYHLQTLKDNIALLTPEVLKEINLVVIKAGHELVKTAHNDSLKGRCDSFVVETNVHFPTDTNLLFDAIRKIVELTSRLCDTAEIPGWRQRKYIIKKVKRGMRQLQKLKHSTSKDPNKTLKRKKKIKTAYTNYSKTSGRIVEKAKESREALLKFGIELSEIEEIDYFIKHAEIQIDLIIRRVIYEEKIPHSEKVFSIFEPHTEWICKGKAGVPVELGLRVCIFEDQFGFILNHQVMQKQTDEKIAVPLIRETKEKFPALNSCSFDKGFHSTQNQEKLREILDAVALPKKGKPTRQEAEYQKSKKYTEAKNKHSAVESAINALEVHGLDKCPDRGIDGFERYVGLAVLARNIQIIGSTLIKRERNALKEERLKHKVAA
jgi:IS5 family transposase